MQSYETELIDLVDERDQVVNTCFRASVDNYPYLFMRIVVCFIVDEQGRLCIMRRSADKACWPNCWAIPGGAVQSGETYEQAMIRELDEEVNLSFNSLSNRLLEHVAPIAEHGPYHKKVFEVIVNSSIISLNMDDFSEYRWLASEQIIALEGKEPMCPDLIYLVKKFYIL
jgi:mutator protein MutT